jgi:hypothetical protein
MPVTASDRAPAAPEVKRSRRWNQVVFQMVSLWGAFTGLLAVTTPCPCCGRIGCPVGLGLFAAAGGVLAFCVRGRNLIARVVARVLGRGQVRED